MTPHGQFHWNELLTRDVDQARRFYEQTIGWTFEAMPMASGTYWVARTPDGKYAGGIMDAAATGSPDTPVTWMSYLSVDDIDQRCEKARSAGATILREPFDIEQVGRIAILRQPDGAVIGWMTPAPMPSQA